MSPTNKLPSIFGRFWNSDTVVLICGPALSISPAACFPRLSASCSGRNCDKKERKNQDRRKKGERSGRRKSVAAAWRKRKPLKLFPVQEEGGGMNIPIPLRSLASSSGGQGPLVFVSSLIICMMYSAALCSVTGKRKTPFWLRWVTAGLNHLRSFKRRVFDRWSVALRSNILVGPRKHLKIEKRLIQINTLQKGKNILSSSYFHCQD